MARKIAIFDAHPDPDPARYVHALAQAYAAGAREAGHEVRSIMLGELDVPILRTREEWSADRSAPQVVQPGQEAIRWADHLVFLYPLWLGDMPALLKAYLEQIMRPGFALDYGDRKFPKRMLSGRSARVVVTMGMPAFFYWAYFGAHSVRSFKRNILGGTGIDPVSSSLIGNVEGSDGHRKRWLERMHAHGSDGD
jgi:putative NADPH-quinone reductase